MFAGDANLDLMGLFTTSTQKFHHIILHELFISIAAISLGVKSHTKAIYPSYPIAYDYKFGPFIQAFFIHWFLLVTATKTDPCVPATVQDEE